MKTTDGVRAATLVATLIKRDLDLDVDAERLAVFVKDNWKAIAPAAHAMHEQEDRTKAVEIGKDEFRPLADVVRAIVRDEVQKLLRVGGVLRA
jgi:N-acetylglucosamine kinase-like BadF-type ATPase